MTINDLKRFDKLIRQIPDPFGTGFPILKKIIAETAEKYDLSVSGMVRKYVAWKWRK